jgi:2-methylaconitate cis-trans-isomerase PrpF
VPGWPAAVADGDQLMFPVVFMRGGTSRGAFVHSDALPSDPALRDRVVLALYGSPDVRQVDGIGGADPLTSKLAIVSRSDRDDADVDYLFAQVGVDAPVVDFGGNCGNMLAGVGPFAVDEGLVAAVEPVTRVLIHNVNTGRIIAAEVPVADGRAQTVGTTHIAGVPRPGARIVLDFAAAAGTLGRGLLPTGRRREELELADGTRIEATIADAANPTAFVAAADIGMTAEELLAAFPPEPAIERLRQVRDAAAAALGLARSAGSAREESPGIPKAYALAPPADYVATDGRPIVASDVSMVGRGLTFGVPHGAYASTVSICTAAAARIPGTVVWDQQPDSERDTAQVRIGHPGGVMPVEVSVDTSDPAAPVLRRAGIDRTARRLMTGLAAVPRSVLDEPGPAG